MHIQITHTIINTSYGTTQLAMYNILHVTYLYEYARSYVFKFLICKIDQDL